MSDNEDFDVRRLILALDASTPSASAVTVAAHFAARLQADLGGLFVEQQDLLDLEEHPAARHISLPFGADGKLERGSLERELRSMALEARRAFDRASRQFRLRVSFDVARGRLRSTVIEKTEPSDLVVVESTGRRLTRAVRLPSSGTRLGAGLQRSVLFLTSAAAPIRSVVVLYDGTHQSRRALGAARRLAATDGIMLTVLVVGETREEAADLVESIESRTPPSARVHTHRIADESADRITRAVQGVHGDLFIVGGDTEVSGVDDIDDFLRELGCPLLVVR
jgi:nucleotide-binding universal stress UspA family protein